MPKLDGVLETALYVADMARARAFYERVLDLRPMVSEAHFAAYDVAGRDVLLLFLHGAAAKPAHLPGGTIPPHDAAGRIHMAFAVAASELPGWEARLAECGIAVEGSVDWPRGSRSIYFRDPDGHLLELATPGLWPIY